MKLTTNDGMTIEGNPEEIMDFYRELQYKDCDSSCGKNNFPSSRFPCDINPEKFPCDCDMNPEKYPCDVEQNGHTCKYIESSPKICKYGRSAVYKCEWERKGYCRQSILTSNPQQYEACEFCSGIPQYKLCSEVDK